MGEAEGAPEARHQPGRCGASMRTIEKSDSSKVTAAEGKRARVDRAGTRRPRRCPRVQKAGIALDRDAAERLGSLRDR